MRMYRRCADDMHVMLGVVLHKIGQLRQVFAWVSAINLTSNNRRSGKSDKRKPSCSWKLLLLFEHFFDKTIQRNSSA